MNVLEIIERLGDMRHHPDCACMDCTTIIQAIIHLKDIDARNNIDYFREIL